MRGYSPEGLAAVLDEIQQNGPDAVDALAAVTARGIGAAPPKWFNDGFRYQSYRLHDPFPVERPRPEDEPDDADVSFGFVKEFVSPGPAPNDRQWHPAGGLLAAWPESIVAGGSAGCLLADNATLRFRYWVHTDESARLNTARAEAEAMHFPPFRIGDTCTGATLRGVGGEFLKFVAAALPPAGYVALNKFAGPSKGRARSVVPWWRPAEVLRLLLMLWPVEKGKPLFATAIGFRTRVRKYVVGLTPMCLERLKVE